ncbi:MAG TPA: phosphatase PAP2 family protein [Rhizomicrobium sp.]|nr:phosphatase PAP2 family protein [Rhizomicrobium sp.]
MSFLFFDRPIAIYAHGLSPRIYHVFGIITQFGESTGYLIVCVVAFAIFYFRRSPSRRYSWLAAFIFVNVAISGIVVDVIKVIFGRARPKLLFSEGLYGFTWLGSGPDRWSFPSGHVATVTALALSLTVIWPRWWPVWWLPALLVVASRVIIGAHYPSDLIGAFYVALLIFWVTRAGFNRCGIAIHGRSNRVSGFLAGNAEIAK